MIYLRNIFIALVLLVVSKNILFTLFAHNDKVVIEGKISPYYEYSINTYYEAESSLPICYGMGSGILFGGSLVAKKTTSFHYEPTINDTHHSISIPLNYEGLNICDYQLRRISLKVANNSHSLFEKHTELEYVGFVNRLNYNSADRTSALIPLLVSHSDHNYTIDFYSMADYDKRVEENLEKEEKQKVSKLKSYRITHKELTLLSESILSPYIKKYKKFPTKNEMKTLLSETEKMNYVEKAQSVKKREELAKNITYVNGTPVDEWGNPFQYKIHLAEGTSTFDYVTLFSFGADGVKSKDDVQSGIHYGLPNPLYDGNHNLKREH